MTNFLHKLYTNDEKGNQIFFKQRRIVILSAPLKINKKRPIQYEPV